MQYKQKIGKFGEDIAVNYLKQKKYKIIDRNIRIGHQEIDILANFKEKIVFIEVKTRVCNQDNLAEEALSRNKIDNIKKAINEYVAINNISEYCVQIDFVAIDIKKAEKKANIKHYHDII